MNAYRHADDCTHPQTCTKLIIFFRHCVSRPHTATLLTEGTHFPIGLHSEDSWLVHNAALKTRAKGHDLAGPNWANLNLEGALGNVLLTKGDIDDIVARLWRHIDTLPHIRLIWQLPYLALLLWASYQGKVFTGSLSVNWEAWEIQNMINLSSEDKGEWGN